MIEVAASEFFTWAEAGQIGFDPRYAEPRCLDFQGVESDSRFWVVPEGNDARRTFAEALVELLDSKEGVRLWPRCGDWSAFSDYPDEIPAGSPMRHVILEGRSGAVLFTHGEGTELADFLSFVALVGGSVCYDVFAVPDDKSIILEMNHHGVAYITAKDPLGLASVIDFLGTRGFPLPTEVPDWTFKRPHWM